MHLGEQGDKQEYIFWSLLEDRYMCVLGAEDQGEG